MARRKETVPSRIPSFKNEIEAGEYWDTHSPEEFPDEFEEVKLKLPRPTYEEVLTVKLEDDTIKELRKVAREMGLPSSTLVRMWILERLKERRAAS